VVDENYLALPTIQFSTSNTAGRSFESESESGKEKVGVKERDATMKNGNVCRDETQIFAAAGKIPDLKRGAVKGGFLPEEGRVVERIRREKVRVLCKVLGVTGSADAILEKIKKKLGAPGEPPEKPDEWRGCVDVDLRRVWLWCRELGKTFEAATAGDFDKGVPVAWELGASDEVVQALRSARCFKWEGTSLEEVFKGGQQAIQGDPLPWEFEMDGREDIEGRVTKAVPGSEEALALAETLAEDVMSGAVHLDGGPGHTGANRLNLPLFVVRSGGKLRVIHDCRKANAFLGKVSVKYEAVVDVLREAPRFACKMDLRAAFKQVRVNPKDWRRLGFEVKGRGRIGGTFRSLPLGMAHSPARMCDAVRPSVVAARALGVRVVWYLDDLLVIGDTREEVVRGVTTVVGLLTRWGLMVSPTKFYPYLCSRLEFLGALIDLEAGTLTIDR
jgi:hypothetical protein